MGKIEAILFDLDGVLVDTAKFHYQGWKRLADEIGIPFDEKANEKLKGVDRQNSLRLLVKKELPEDEMNRLCDRKNGYYLELVSTLKPEDLLPGVLRLLDEIDAAGLKKAVCSSSKNTKTILEKTGLNKRFRAIVDGNDLHKGKPDPEIFLLGAERLKVRPEVCLVVEDAEVGVESGLRAGMYVLGIGDKTQLGKADLVTKDLSKITLEQILEIAKR